MTGRHAAFVFELIEAFFMRLRRKTKMRLLLVI
jgi:hypothetical protein